MSKEIRPEVAAWGLASRKGWINIDQDLLARMIWVICPPFFPEGEDRESWADESAGLWWQLSGWKYGKREVGALAEMLSAIHQDLYAAGHCHQALIHLPRPNMVPLPVQIGIWAMAGDRDEQLRLLTQADEPAAVEPPIIEEFTTERLGTGLKALHYRREPGGTRLDGYLNYAWRSEQYETDLRLFTFSSDMSRLHAALPDIDDLARAIELVPRQW